MCSVLLWALPFTQNINSKYTQANNSNGINSSNGSFLILVESEKSLCCVVRGSIWMHKKSWTNWQINRQSSNPYYEIFLLPKRLHHARDFLKEFSGETTNCHKSALHSEFWQPHSNSNKLHSHLSVGIKYIAPLFIPKRGGQWKRLEGGWNLWINRTIQSKTALKSRNLQLQIFHPLNT